MAATANSKPKTLAEALVAAQAEMPAVEPDKTNPHFRNRYVSLGQLLAKTRPVLNRHGIVVAQFPSANDAGQPTLVTVLLHESGERLEYAAPLFLPKTDPQGQGSAITYMRRYALASALGISDMEDDDGNAGSRSASPEPATQRANGEAASRGQRDALAKIATDLEKDGRIARSQLDAACQNAGYASFAEAVEKMGADEAAVLLSRIERFAKNAGAAV